MPTVILSTGSLFYREQGSGDPLLLLHANPGDSRDFDAVVPTLAQHFRVLALDWPGYGRSVFPPQPEQADCLLFFNVLKEFIEALALPPVLMVGCSLGGNAAARLAIEAPEQVRGLVLVSPGGFTEHDRITLGFCHLQSSPLALTPYRWASQYLKIRNSVTDAMLKRARVEQSFPLRRQLNRAVWRSFSQPEHDLRDRAADIRCPVLMLFGERDPAIPARKDGKVAQRCIPHAQKKVLPCGHMAFAEMPDSFLQTTLPFLQRCGEVLEPA